MTDNRRAILKMIVDDMAADTERREGLPFDGRTVAAALGEISATIAGLAEIVATLLPTEEAEAEERPEHDRYFITVEGAPEREVTKAVYVDIERGCGFRNTLGQPDEPATSSFGSGGIRGRIAYGRGMGLTEGGA